MGNQDSYDSYETKTLSTTKCTKILNPIFLCQVLRSGFSPQLIEIVFHKHLQPSHCSNLAANIQLT